MLHSVRRRPRAHFLHVGKTGGSAIRSALDPVRKAGPFRLILHDHEFTLHQIPEGERFFFSVRDPVERFVSGFNSRRRQGRPLYDNPWRPPEVVAFRRFATAESLALALSSDDVPVRTAAEEAMRGIGHVRRSYWDWFGDPVYLKSRRADLLAVLWVESLDLSFAQLRMRLALPETVELPRDRLIANQAPEDTRTRVMSAQAIQNLRSWYDADYEFIELCRELEGEISE